jgi:glycosyltransferase involved in cell wall biosynthesis
MEFLHVDSIAGFFKREMLAGADYGPGSYPLPFAYPDRRVPQDVEGPRNTPIFWAGHRQFGLRRLYLEHLESARGLKLDAVCDQTEYVRALLDTRIGLNIFGCGFDTVRYWELPAHGCMLLSERLPIRIPHNFRDGESAVFFDDTQDLEEKIEYYLAHPEEIRAIARAGHEHFKRHHTGSMRARQLLAWMNVPVS